MLKSPDMKIGDIDLHVEILGSGPHLVLLHGGPGLTCDIFRPALDQAADSATLVYYDQRGCGRSSHLGDGVECGVAEHLADLDGLRAALGAERILLLGHSWGAYLALAYALEHEAHVEKLILVSPAPPYMEGEEQIHRWHSLLTPAMRKQVSRITMSTLPPGEKAKQRLEVELPLYFHNLVAMEDFRRRGFTVCGEVAENLAAPGALPDLRPRMPKLRVPVRIITGENDRRTPLEVAKEIQENLYFSRLMTIDACGHFPFLERPRTFIKLLLQELAEA